MKAGEEGADEVHEEVFDDESGPPNGGTLISGLLWRAFAVLLCSRPSDSLLIELGLVIFE